jgi:hypothetical protein
LRPSHQRAPTESGECMQETIDLGSISVLLAGTVGTIAVMASSIAAVTVSRHNNVRPTKARKRGHSFLAERLTMTVDAQNKMNEQLLLRFKIADPDITLFRIELATQLDKAAGIIDCVSAIPRYLSPPRNPKSFSAGITRIDIGTARRSSFQSVCS